MAHIFTYNLLTGAFPPVTVSPEYLRFRLPDWGCCIDRLDLRPCLRNLGVALVLVLSTCGMPLGMLPVAASPSFDNTSTGGVPTATSFTYPVGAGTIQPTWDSANRNGYFISQGFNTSCDPSANQGYYLYGLYYCGHTGVDLATSLASSAVHATAAGLVVSAGYNGGYGVMVRIRHFLPDGSLVYSQYEHMAYGSLAVYSGEVVSQGQELGLVGATGFATGAHLHFELKSVNEDGYGYTFGNTSLITGYLDPLSFVASHQLQPATFIASSGHTVQAFPAESEALLRNFLHSYRHFVQVTISDGLHVRSGPGLHYPILGTALRGAKLGYVHTQGTWIQVALPQQVKGWVNQDFVTGYQNWDAIDAAKHRTAWPPAGPVATVNTLGLNVRSAPGQNHKIVDSVYEGDKVALLSLTTSWAHIKTRDGTTGWVLRQYIHEPGQKSPSQPTYIVPSVPMLHVRTGPGLQFPVSGAVYVGTKMQFVRGTPHWAAVILPGGTTGWVARPLTANVHLTSAVLHTPVALTKKQVQHTSIKVQSRHAKTVVQSRTVKAKSAGTGRALIAHESFLTVTTPILNVRSGPGQNHRVVARVRDKTTLQLLSLTSHWAHIALPASSIDGWVLRSLTR
ncbi:MAG: N-acetylmuramoyl-L-alanine amidase [Chloroflexi bacterium]|jgi:uncharacterized protein YgiM (DUF1202 family)|nr:N-acetylmuramoyl-L-alanine amidase [Chloroflexota bacterium]